MTASFTSSRTSLPTGANSTDSQAPPAVVCLEVVRGSTQYPKRQFAVGRFLIGAGEQCDLRLGGNGMPVIHSILQFDGGAGLIEAVAASPAIKVNGQVRQTSRLHFGDMIAIGGVEFAVRAPETSDSVQPAPATHDAAWEGPDCEEERTLHSAVELVELIEAEVHRIEDYQSRRQLGAEALLQQALRRAASHDAQPDVYEALEPDSCDDVHDNASVGATRQPLPLVTANDQVTPETDRTQRVAGELDEIISRLDGFSEQLERRSKRLVEHEAGYLEASLELLKAQQRLADHLEFLHQQIESLEATHSKTLRASA